MSRVDALGIWRASRFLEIAPPPDSRYLEGLFQLLHIETDDDRAVDIYHRKAYAAALCLDLARELRVFLRVALIESYIVLLEEFFDPYAPGAIILGIDNDFVHYTAWAGKH
jgi:hypothetical protein